MRLGVLSPLQRDINRCVQTFPWRILKAEATPTTAYRKGFGGHAK